MNLMDLSKYDHKIFTLDNTNFESTAIQVFRFQYHNNSVYHDYTNALGVDPTLVQSLTQIPFLPIRFFKTHLVVSTVFDPAIIFESSGTTGSVNSRHVVKDLSLYKKSFTLGFEKFYGPVKDYCVIGLLPSYLERGGSSLVYMVNELINESGHSQSGFYLNEYDKLSETLTRLEEAKQKTILVGVTFALLDFAEQKRLELKHTTIMETGGMKGRREVMVREEVHKHLRDAFNVPSIHSEYGMTELLSQAYSKGEGIFQNPAWMKVVIRDDEDPLSVVSRESSVVSRQSVQGAINIIDLANIYSCSFIATDDVGRLYDDGSFEVSGRMDNSDVRGCSLMLV